MKTIRTIAVRVCLPVLLTALPVLTSAQASRSYELRGVASSRLFPLLEALSRNPTAFVSSPDSLLRHWYRGRGWYRASVDSMRGDTLWVTEGKPTVLEGLLLEGLTPTEQGDALASFRLRPGDPFIESILAEDIRTIISDLGDGGYLAVTASVGNMHETEDDESFRLRVSLEIDKGERATIGALRFAGLGATRLTAVQPLSGLEKGEFWTRRGGESAQRRLNRLQIFSDVSDPTLTRMGENEVGVLFDVREGRSNAFDGVLGYLPPAVGTQTGTVMGMVNLQFRNLFGTARRFSARWYQERQGRHQINVGYREPSIFGFLASAEAGLAQRREDSVYVRFDASMELDIEVGADMFAGLTLSASTTNPVEGYGRSVISQSGTTIVGARFENDTRDRPFPARRGVLFSTELGAGTKRSVFLGTTTTNSVRRVSFDAALYTPIVLFHSFALEFHWREVKGGGTDQSDLFRIGGSTTLRGYREGEFLGSRVMWQTSEYRVFLSPSSYFGGFVDLGLIDGGSAAGPGVLSSSIFRVGYGMTALVDTPVGAVGLSIALGKGDGLGEAKLHVRLMTEF